MKNFLVIVGLVVIGLALSELLEMIPVVNLLHWEFIIGMIFGFYYFLV
jgi:hypothetical protein